MTDAFWITAHDTAGDGETIRHCPYCGSGGVVARSDGTVECTVCEEVFNVKGQPKNMAVPQNIHGQPVGENGQTDADPAVVEAPVDEPAAPGPTISDDDLDFDEIEGEVVEEEQVREAGRHRLRFVMALGSARGGR